MMNLGVIHHQNRPWTWIRVTEGKDAVFDKSVEQLCRKRALKDLPVEEAINSVDRKKRPPFCAFDGLIYVRGDANI